MQAQFDSSRGFGVEIETAVTRNHDPRSIAIALQDAGIPAVSTSGHTTRTEWKVVPDGSTGSEIVSPILYGEDGLNQIKAVCEVLRSIGLRVDSTTGLHVHHDASNLTARQFAGAMYLYAKAYSFMNSLLPTRVGRSWCRPLSLNTLRYNYDNMVRGNGSAKYMMSGCTCGINRSHYCTHRYYATNPCNANGTGTLEFRQHSGSLNGTKIASWVVFTQSFINAACVRNIDSSEMVSQNPDAEHLMWLLGRDTNCEITKSARRNIVRRVHVNFPDIDLGNAKRYLTSEQRRHLRSRSAAAAAPRLTGRMDIVTGRITWD